MDVRCLTHIFMDVDVPVDTQSVSFICFEKGTQYHWLSRIAISFKQVAGLLCNHWPASRGISGPNEMEWVAGMAWNTQVLEGIR